MITPHEKNAFYVKALAEHREVRHLIDDIEARLKAASGQQAIGDADRRNLCERLAGLRSHLQAHFAEESAGGLLDEIVSRLPRLGPQGTAIERQHAPLLKQIFDLAGKAQDCGCSADQWRKVADDFHPFAQALLAHEAAENRLAAEALNGEPADNGL